jgi:hypothetical protein
MIYARSVIGAASPLWRKAAHGKGVRGDSQSFRKGVDHERRNGCHHRHGGRANVRYGSHVDRQAGRCHHRQGGTTTVTDVTAGQSVTCTSSTAKGTFKSGKGLSGTGIGTITSLTVSGCSVLGMNISLTITGKMPVNAVSFNSTKRVVTMFLTNIHGSLSTSGCSATIDGTGVAAHNGKVKATYSDGTGKLPY